MSPELTVLADGLTFTEGPRWHDGRLYFSDFFSHRVLAVDGDGRLETIATVEQQPSGLGWTPDGDLLIVSMVDRRLLRLGGSGLETVADLSTHAPWHCNDMVVDAHGRAYVGNFGFDLDGGAEPTPTCLLRIDLDGSVHRAAENVLFPNGSVLTPDGATLIVAETFGRKLSAWQVGVDGSLSKRRVWADLGEGIPDGICLDAEGCVWYADPRANEVVRVREGGEVAQRLSTGEYGAFACMLGGNQRTVLYICTCLGSGPAIAEQRSARIETIEVEIPGAGLP